MIENLGSLPSGVLTLRGLNSKRHLFELNSLVWAAVCVFTFRWSSLVVVCWRFCLLPLFCFD